MVAFRWDHVNSAAIMDERPALPGRMSEQFHVARGHQGMEATPDSGHLTAQARRREDLARIAKPGWVEGAPEQLHGVQVVGPEHLLHVPRLVDANPVLPGD